MRKFVVAAGLPALFLSLSACEATLMSEQLDYHEMQGVSFMVYREEDAVLGGAQIVHRAHNPHAQPVCARVAGHRWVIVQPGQTADIATQGPGATSANHQVGPVKPGGDC